MHKQSHYLYLLLIYLLSWRPSQITRDSASHKNEIRVAAAQNWFEKSIFMLHEDHHIKAETEVGKNADPEETARIIALSRPDAIQIHAKGRPGFASYPTKTGWMAPKYERDVLKVWRDIARKDGYHFSIYYNLGRDSEIQVRKPKWNRVAPDGRLQDAALCYHSGVAEGYLWPMIEEIITTYQPNGLWFDGSVFTIKNCYCDVCRARFQKEQTLPVPVKPGKAGWTAYKDMQRQIYREFLFKTVDRIKKKDPECLVAINLAYSMHMPEKPYKGLDYFTADFGNEVEELSQEAHWYDNQDKPFEMMTTVHLDGGNGKGRQPKPKGQLEQEMAIIIANGGRYNAWDNPDSKSAISVQMGKHMQEVVSPFLRARQPWLLQTQRLPDVSLLYSATDHYAATDSASNAFLSATSFIPVTDKILQAGINYEMLPEYKLANNDIKGKLLIVEDPAALSDNNIKCLRNFTESGSTILVTGRGILPLNMAELLGIFINKSEAVRVDVNVTNNKEVYSFKPTGYQTETKGAQVLLKTKDALGNEYPFFTSHPVGKGKAMAVMAPLLSKEKTKSQDVPAALIKEILERALPSEQRLFVAVAPATAETVLRKKGKKHILHMVNHAKGERELIKITWHKYYKISDIPPSPATHVSMKIAAKPTSVKLQPQNEELKNWQYKNGRLEADIPGFDIHQMLVVE